MLIPVLMLPPPTPASTSAALPQPSLTAVIGQVGCPARQVPVTVVNGTGEALPYDLFTGFERVRAEQVPANRTVTRTVRLAEGQRTMVTVRSGGRVIAATRRTAHCRKGAARHAGRHGGETGEAAHAKAEGPGSRLPHTGPGLSAGAWMVVGGLAGGGVLLFWGMLWPGSGRGDWAAPVRRTR
ncbi:hypothetical protein [Actinomadura macrotermitis]|uniref:Uncharacterized protein n=1 Tax=Actinomadura macrotermitis TaxID=2585200 RepID=A0A7K0BZY0_9ACTN|nr:hypothetical protein [Actinomadura macrotermitis]MQY06758.1 hypothetical protein [Actinomadura macrotermitis]